MGGAGDGQRRASTCARARCGTRRSRATSFGGVDRSDFGALRTNAPQPGGRIRAPGAGGYGSRGVNGYVALAKKELRESLKTSRLLIACVVFVLAGCGGVILTHYLPDLVRSQASSGITILVPKQTVVDAVDAYVKNVAQIPMLAVILLAMGAVADERAHGIGAMILSRPVSRAAYLLAKLTGHGL